jgi:DDE superfamily endonuclease
LATQRLPPRPERRWGLPPPVRVLLVLTHLRTNPTTRGLAAWFGTSQSAVDRIIDHLVPVPAHQPQPATDTSHHARIIDATPIPVHDQSITAIPKNNRRPINTHIITCSSAAPHAGSQPVPAR